MTKKNSTNSQSVFRFLIATSAAMSLIMGASFAFSAPNQEAYQLATYSTPDPHALGEFLKSKGFDVAGMDESTQKVEVVLEDTTSLQNLNLLMSYMGALYPGKQVSLEAGGPYRELVADKDMIDVYYDEKESAEALLELETTYPAYAKRFNLNDWLGQSPTVEGRNLYGLQVSVNPSALEDEPKVLVIGQHHARELMTHHATIDLARAALQAIAKEETGLKEWAKTNSIWFVPVVNPDGLHHVFAKERFWRKNRSRNRNGTFGVDLNRNYQFKWGACGNHSADPRSEIYKGSKANSEPEVVVMDALNRKLQAQIVVSFHSSGNEVLYAYRCGKMAEASTYYGLRDRMARAVGFGQRVASSSGEDFEHHYARYGSLAYLLEIGTSFQPTFDVYENTVRPSILKLLPLFKNETESKEWVKFEVRSKAGAAIRGAKLRLTEIKFAEGETRQTDDFGSFRWRLTPGNYALEVEAPGYEPQLNKFDSRKLGARGALEIELTPVE